MTSSWGAAHCLCHCWNVRFCDGSPRPNNKICAKEKALMTQLRSFRHLRGMTSPWGVSFSGSNRRLALLTLIGCAAMIFSSGVDHIHATPTALDEDCIVCDSSGAKSLTATYVLSLPSAFGFANEASWSAFHPFLPRFNTAAPRAPPPQLAFA